MVMAFALMTSRIAAPRSLVIFLAIMTTRPPNTGATTSGISCVDEYGACAMSTVCMECLMDFDTGQYTECQMDLIADFDITADNMDSCEFLSVSSCCIDASSNNNCMADDAFVEYRLCSMNSNLDAVDVDGGECTAITCDFDDGADGTGTTDEDEAGTDSAGTTDEDGAEADSAGTTDSNGAFRADSFPFRVALGLALGIASFALSV